MTATTHNPFDEIHWASCLRENLTSSSYGEGLETGRASAKAPRQSLTRQLFFKWIKQHLKIKQWFGRSENAVKIQILCALIAYLLLALYHKTHGVTTSLWVMLGELRTTLFQRPATDAAVQRRRCQARTELKQLQPELFA